MSVSTNCTECPDTCDGGCEVFEDWQNLDLLNELMPDDDDDDLISAAVGQSDPLRTDDDLDALLVAHEDDIARGLGLQFIHIPVEWDSPNPADFVAFAAVMQTHGSGRTLVHCEVNFRASVFGFLYQVLYQGADVDEAMSLMQSIWVPNDTWEAFIVRVMSDRGIDYPAL